MRNELCSPQVSRRSRWIGIWGTFAGHATLLFFFWGTVSSASMSELPPPVEAPLIALHVVSTPVPQPACPPSEPEVAPTIQEKEALIQDSEPKPERPKPEKIKPPKKQQQKSVHTPTDETAEHTAQVLAKQAEQKALESARQTILSYLIAQIERHKRYPNTARKLGLEGVVRIVVSIDHSGNITSVHIDSGDVHPVLQRAANETMTKVRAGWKQQATPAPLSVTIPMRYSLTER